MRSYNLDNKAFVTTGNEQGLANPDTVFRYFQTGEIITGRYRGGHIKEGLIVGKQIGPDKIELLYQCITNANELKCGQSKGIISEDEEGKLLLNFDWNWLNSEGSGQSFYKEVIK